MKLKYATVAALLLFPLFAHAVLTGPSPALPPVPSPGIGTKPSTESAPVIPANQAARPSAVVIQPSSSSISSVTSEASSSSSAKAQNCSNITARRSRVDSLFSQGAWKQVVPLADELCPCAPTRVRITCRLQSIRALAQDNSTISDAMSRLEDLSITAEPEETGYSDMMILQTTLLIQTRQAQKALKSWKLAKQSASNAQDVELKALCTQLRSLLKDSTLVSDCAKIPALSKVLAAAIPLAASSSSTAVSSSANQAQVIAPQTSPDGSWVLQFGAFSSRDNADLLLKNLKSRKVSSRIITKNTTTKVLWLVQTEPFETKESAQEYERITLDPLGLDPQLLKIQ